MTDNSWRSQILEELQSKRKALTSIYRTFDRTVDLRLLDGVAEFLLGVRDELPDEINYDPLPQGEAWRLADLDPKNVNHLVWTLASLCRFSCALPFFRKLRDTGENCCCPGGVVSDWHVGVQLYMMSQREDEMDAIPPMDMLLTCLLSHLLPSLLATEQWLGFPLRYGFQVMGYLFIEEPKQDRPASMEEWSAELLDPSEDVTLESVTSSTLRRLRSFSLTGKESLAIPLLYGPENDCFYLSGIRALMGQSTLIDGPGSLHQLRSHIDARVSRADLNMSVAPMGDGVDISLEAGTPSFAQNDLPLMRLLDHAGSQLSTIREHMFNEALRQEPSLQHANSVADYVQAVASVLYRCQPYECAFLWVLDEMEPGYQLAWTAGYGKAADLGATGRMLTSCLDKVPWEDLNLPPDYLTPYVKVPQAPVVQPVDDIPEPLLSRVPGGTPATVRTRMLIPLMTKTSGSQAGCVVELYWRHRYRDMLPFFVEIGSLVARAARLAQDIANDFKKSKKVGYEQGEFTIAHEIGPSIGILNKERHNLSDAGKIAVDYLEIWKRFVRRDWSEPFPEAMAKVFTSRGLLFEAALRFGYHRARRRSVAPKMKVGNRRELWSYEEMRNAMEYWLDASIDLPSEILVQNDEDISHPGWVYQTQTWLLFHLIGACHHCIRYAFQRSAPFSEWKAATGIRKCALTTIWSEKGGDIEIVVSNTGGPKEPQPIVRLDEIRAIRSSDLGDEIVMPISTGPKQGAGDRRRVIVRPARADKELSDGSFLWTAKVWVRRERGDGDE